MRNVSIAILVLLLCVGFTACARDRRYIVMGGAKTDTTITEAEELQTPDPLATLPTQKKQKPEKGISQVTEAAGQTATQVPFAVPPATEPAPQAPSVRPSSPAPETQMPSTPSAAPVKPKLTEEIRQDIETKIRKSIERSC